ncbi:unnamed protein product [Calicophoron daubneyi]|uniref:Uncharacterized protein n=1 Tax=Calicophoron daubneyi TaxID=300641 RepID=A0AAV2T4V3_CALDB
MQISPAQSVFRVQLSEDQPPFLGFSPLPMLSFVLSCVVLLYPDLLMILATRFSVLCWTQSNKQHPRLVYTHVLLYAIAMACVPKVGLLYLPAPFSLYFHLFGQ